MHRGSHTSPQPATDVEGARGNNGSGGDRPSSLAVGWDQGLLGIPLHSGQHPVLPGPSPFPHGVAASQNAGPGSVIPNPGNPIAHTRGWSFAGPSWEANPNHVPARPASPPRNIFPGLNNWVPNFVSLENLHLTPDTRASPQQLVSEGTPQSGHNQPFSRKHFRLQRLFPWKRLLRRHDKYFYYVQKYFHGLKKHLFPWILTFPVSDRP